MALRVFRLWLVLSVLWIGGVGYVTWRDFPVDRLLTPGKAPPGEFDPDDFLARHLPDFDPSNPSKQYVLV